MNITQILLGIIILIGGIVGLFVVPYLKTHMTAEQINILVGIAQTVVYAAEKIKRENMDDYIYINGNRYKQSLIGKATNTINGVY